MPSQSKRELTGEDLVALRVSASDLTVGDWRQHTEDFITRVRSVEVYKRMIEPFEPDPNYIVVNGILPPIHVDEIVKVWR